MVYDGCLLNIFEWWNCGFVFVIVWFKIKVLVWYVVVVVLMRIKIVMLCVVIKIESVILFEGVLKFVEDNRILFVIIR